MDSFPATPLSPCADDQGEWATATKKKKAPASHQHSRGGGGYANGRGMDDRRGGRGGMPDKMRGVRSVRVLSGSRVVYCCCCACTLLLSGCGRLAGFVKVWVVARGRQNRVSRRR